MEIVEVKGNESNSKILIGESLDHLQNYTEGKKPFIITDRNVDHLYRERFPNAQK